MAQEKEAGCKAADLPETYHCFSLEIKYGLHGVEFCAGVSDHDLLFSEKGTEPAGQVGNGAQFPVLPPPGQRSSSTPSAIRRKPSSSAASKPGADLHLRSSFSSDISNRSGEWHYLPCRINHTFVSQEQAGRERVTSASCSSAPSPWACRKSSRQQRSPPQMLRQTGACKEMRHFSEEFAK